MIAALLTTSTSLLMATPAQPPALPLTAVMSTPLLMATPASTPPPTAVMLTVRITAKEASGLRRQIQEHQKKHQINQGHSNRQTTTNPSAFNHWSAQSHNNQQWTIHPQHHPLHSAPTTFHHVVMHRHLIQVTSLMYLPAATDGPTKNCQVLTHGSKDRTRLVKSSFKQLREDFTEDKIGQ